MLCQNTYYIIRIIINKKFLSLAYFKLKNFHYLQIYFYEYKNKSLKQRIYEKSFCQNILNKYIAK